MHRSRRAGLPALIVVLALTLAACGGGSAASPTDAGDGDGGGGGGESAESVSLAGGQFSPTSLTVAAGTTVTFTDTGGHTVTEGSNGTADEDPIVDETGGEDIEVTFDEPGTYNLTCKIHASMNMTVTVEG